jgi:hypothetical protein
MKFIVGLIIAIAIGAAVFVSLNKSDQTSVAPVTPSPTEAPQFQSFTAHFAIFTNGTFRIFTDKKYHNQAPQVFITDINPNEVHVTQSGITWQQFFDTLPMKLTKDCLTTGTGQVFCEDLKFFINGEIVANALDQEIKPGDKLLVSVGQTDKRSELQKLEEVSQ